jgi:hypothetical protein
MSCERSVTSGTRFARTSMRTSRPKKIALLPTVSTMTHGSSV